MRIEVLFFASLTDVVGARRMTLDLPAGSTVAGLLDRLVERHPRIGAYRPVLLTAVNETYVDAAHPLNEGDEVAVFPPVSGGESAGEAARVLPDQFYEITRAPIAAAALSARLRRDADGAICVFEGVVRNHSQGRATQYLVYEAYEAMALKQLEEIGALVRQVWDVGAVGIVHRLGRLEIGETSVAVVVTSPHRRAAFDACHYAIDRLKKTVPIWKKEYFADGEVWVEGQ